MRSMHSNAARTPAVGRLGRRAAPVRRWAAPVGRRAALLAACVGCGAALIAAAPAGAAVSGSLTRYPYLTDSIQSSVTINWATTTAATTGSVRYGRSGACTGSSKSASRTAIAVNGVAEYQWKATIPVRPDTPYCYRVWLGGTDLLATDPSPAFTSQVAAGSAAPFSFAVFGDWGQAYAGSANPDQANVLGQMAGSGARFAVMTGDTGYPNGSQTNYGDLQQTGPDVSGVFGPSFWTVPGRSLPVFNVPGNHGFFAGATQTVNWPEGNAARTSGGRYATEAYPSIGGTVAGRYPSFWYAFDAGPARFYVLTAAWGDDTAGPAGAYAADAAQHFTPSRAEYRWLARDLAAHPRALKFAFWHYPIYADTVNAESDTALQGGPGTLQGLLNAHEVNVAFNGHAHGYERNRPDAGGMVSYVLGNGGADLGPISSCSAFDLYAIGAYGTHCGFAPAGLTNDHVFGFAKVTVNGQQVTVAPTDELGRTYDVQTYVFVPGQAPVLVPPPAPPAPPPAAAPPPPPPVARACAKRARGGRHADHMRGTREGDRLLGMAGNDLLEGFAGADCLSGMAGRDVLRGGTGNDRLLGGTGDDRLVGGTGNDRLFGGTGKDRLVGGRGNDRLVGGTGNDRLAGGTGADVLEGGTGRDRLAGGNGRDVLLGGAGRDSIDARDRSRDRVRCGTGRDVARVDARDRTSGCERVIRTPPRAQRG